MPDFNKLIESYEYTEDENEDFCNVVFLHTTNETENENDE